MGNFQNKPPISLPKIFQPPDAVLMEKRRDFDGTTPYHGTRKPYKGVRLMEKTVQFPQAEYPEREYYAAPRRRWKRRRKRRLPAALAGVLLFACGFLMGRAGAVPTAEAGTGPAAASGTPVQILDAGTAAKPPAEGGDGEDWALIPPEPPAVNGPEAGEDWALRLVNRENPLPEDFQVPELTRLRNGHAFDSRAYPSLQSMMDAAREAGLRPLICSSCRTWDKQEELFEAKTRYYLDQGFDRAEAEEKAASWVARPGTSEHQTGLAVDIVDEAYQLLDEAQEDTAVQKWLMAHCAEYGFILRYPTEKSTLTGVNYEPWHYRYVGETAAREIMERGLCLEEYAV